MANFSGNRKAGAPVLREPVGAPRGDVESLQSVARYLADMTGQLEAMARGAKFELLAYLLAMARAEAEAAALEAKGEAAADTPRQA